MIKKKSNKRVINKIIKNLGIKTKNYWKTLLKTIPPHQVGVIKVGGEVLYGKNLDNLSIEIKYLSKETGFYLPLVIGPKIRFDKLDSFKESNNKNGVRVITKDMISEIVEIVKNTEEKVIDSLNNAGLEVVNIPFEEIRVTPHGEEIGKNKEAIDVGYLGEVITIDTKPIIQAIYEQKVPLISNIGMYKDEYYLLNATDLAAELVKFLQAKKLIILGDEPILDNKKNVIKAIYSELESIKLTRNGTIRGAMIKNCKEAYDLLNYLGPGHSVQITSLKYEGEKISSTGLIEELLGNGSGTILLMPHIVTGYPLDMMDKHFLKIVEEKINVSFKDQKKRLVKSYFNKVLKNDSTLYLDPKQKGGAITYPIDGAEYMCKLFTDKDYEGLGLGTSIIDHIFLQKGSVTWRTSITNKAAIQIYDNIIKHYNKNNINTFNVKKEKYKIYGLGIEETKSKDIIDFVQKLEKTLEVFK